MGSEETNIDSSSELNRGQIYYYLRSRLPRDHQELLSRVEAQRVPAEVSRVRAAGMITLSSICVRNCVYCPFSADQTAAHRFRLSRSEILSAAEQAAAAGIKWLVLKAGDDPGFTAHAVAELVRSLSENFGFTLTLALGERRPEVLRLWREAGAVSYWLRHETCDQHIYRRVRPSMFWVDRMTALAAVKDAGFALAGGVMIGLPNQSLENLVEDLVFMKDPAYFGLALEPYLPPPGSPGELLIRKPENQIISPDQEALLKAIALARLLRPEMVIMLTNILHAQYSAYTAPDFFRAGANALLLDFTPVEAAAGEAPAPFSGFPARSGEGISEIKERLDALGLTLTFSPPGGEEGWG